MNGKRKSVSVSRAVDDHDALRRFKRAPEEAMDGLLLRVVSKTVADEQRALLHADRKAVASEDEGISAALPAQAPWSRGVALPPPMRATLGVVSGGDGRVVGFYVVDFEYIERH